MDPNTPDSPGASESLGPLVLVVDDEERIQRFVRAALEAQGFRVEQAFTGKDAIRLASLKPPELIILDLGLPDMDGLDVTRQLRGWSSVPILVLSARHGEHDKIDALDAGADDYITKPFGVGELSARIRVALRHARQAPGEARGALFENGDLRVDLARRQVFVGGRDVKLTQTEYRLLAHLVKHAGRVVTHTQLLTEIWGPARKDETHYLRVYMGQLRRKVEPVPAQPRYLLTETGVGYRLAAE
jgi:two-component system KDP operon response regulator KdpE